MRPAWLRKTTQDAITYGQGYYKRGARHRYNPLRYILGPIYTRWIPVKDMIQAEPIGIASRITEGAHYGLLFKPFAPETVAGMIPFLPFSYKMPCGNTFTITDILQIPEYEVPCPCGNPKHWLIKHGEE